LVQVQPDADIFPVRSAYDGGNDGTIGANYLSIKQGIWFTLADCLASQILTGKSVKVIKAIVFQPLAPQPNLQSVKIADDRLIDPYKDDFFKILIEQRQEFKRCRDNAVDDKVREEFDIKQNTVKIATNATSYGIFAEVNVNDRPEKKLSRIFGACDEPFLYESNKIEQPGRYFHPLLATVITGGARLMLAITERLVTDAGLEWAFCDTDSIAIAKPIGMSTDQFNKKVDQIVGWFRTLNPYRFDGDILKIEDVNYSFENKSVRKPLYVWAVSAKRYVLFNDNNGNPAIRKASAHGLGHFHPPYGDDTNTPGIPSPSVKLSKIGVHRWQYDLWWTIAKAAIDGKPDDALQFDFHPTLKYPAMSRYAATTTRNLKWFDKYNSDRAYSDKIKPFGFVSALYARGFEGNGRNDSVKRNGGDEVVAIKPVAPYERDPRRVAKLAFDRNTGKPVPADQLKSYQEALAQYHLHPEDKFLYGDYLDRGTTQRRHVRVNKFQYIGKESHKWEEQYYFGFNEEDQINYGARPATRKSVARSVRTIVDKRGLRDTAKELGLSRDTISKLLATGFAGCPRGFMQRIFEGVRRINSQVDQKKRETAKLLALARREVRRIGMAEFARRLNVDPSNLSKMISRGTLSASVRGALQAYFVSV
jgi:hypothetical protein